MTSSLEANLDAQLKFLNLAAGRALSKLFTEKVLNTFIAVNEPEPNNFEVSVGLYVQVSEEEKQLVLFSKPATLDAQAMFQASIFDTVVSLTGAALNVVQLELQAEDKAVPVGLRMSYSTLDAHSHWEPVYEDEPALNAGQWIRKLLEQEGV